MMLLLFNSAFVFSGAQESTYKEVSWDDLMPEGWMPSEPPSDAAFFEGETLEGEAVSLPSTDMAPVVKSLDKQKLKMPGYILPIKFSDERLTEFLLVPYVGACVHTPPPPENQIVYVSLKKPMEMEDMWAPVWVSGVMNAKVSMTELATAGYHMTDAKSEPYEY